MTQPAKVQEPSMEEILASIRRIIADDEAKPAEKPASAAASAGSASPGAAPPAAKPAVMTDIPPSAIAAAQATPAKAPEPPPGASNSQDDIDAMLAGLDAATSEAEVRPPLPDGEVFDLTDEMALPDPQPAPFRKVEPDDDLEFNETVAASAPPRAQQRQPAFEPPPLYESPGATAANFVAFDGFGGGVGVQHARQHGAEQQRADAGRPGQGNAAADAEILARRQPAWPRRAHRQGGNRAGFPRPLTLLPTSAISGLIQAAHRSYRPRRRDLPC